MGFIAKKLLVVPQHAAKEIAEAVVLGSKISPALMYMNVQNIELTHEHVFFSDGTNIGFNPGGQSWLGGVVGVGGFFYYGKNDPEIQSFAIDKRNLSDNVLKQACLNCKGKVPYLGIGHNCQTWAQRVYVEYLRLSFLRVPGVTGKINSQMHAVPSNPHFRELAP